MKYQINEKRLLQLIERFLNGRKKPSEVCDYLIDFDSDFDRVVVNIFYKKNTDHSLRYKIEVDVIDDIQGFFRITPFIYTHVGDC